MEWLRRCYRSNFKLFRGRPDIITPGRYVFCPPDTPFYPGFHNFGSLNWTKGNGWPVPELGDQLGSSYARWTNGSPPARYPGARLIGSAECIERGDVYESASTWSTSESNASIDIDAATASIDLPLLIPAGPHDVAVQEVSATRTFDLATPRLVKWFLEGECEVLTINGDVRVGVSIDGQGVSGADVIYPPIAGPGSFATSGEFTLPAGEHVLRVEVSRSRRGSLAGATASFFMEFDPAFTYDATSYLDGFQLACYPPAAPFPPAARAPLDISTRADQASIADLLALQYTDQVAAELLAGVLLPGSVVTGVANNATFVPGTIIAQDLRGAWVFVSGTTTPQQWALQGANGLIAPQEVGPFGTSLFWMTSSSFVSGRMAAAGINSDEPLTMVGHSYGGVLAFLIAALARLTNPARTINVLTFGMPVPGDARLAEISLQLRALHFANWGDPIPSVPPNLALLDWSVWFLPPALRPVWLRWAKPRNQLLLLETGDIIDTQEFSLELGEMQQVLADIAAGVPVGIFTPHTMEVYRDRLAL